MAYEHYLNEPGSDDWSAEFRETWESVPGVSYFRGYETEVAEGMFYAGFIDRTLTRDERETAREDFFEFTGLPGGMFPWSEWREAMGYPDR